MQEQLRRPWTRLTIPLHLRPVCACFRVRGASVRLTITRGAAAEAEYEAALKRRAAMTRDADRETLEVAYGRLASGSASSGECGATVRLRRIAIFGGINVSLDPSARGYCSSVAVNVLFVPPPPVFGATPRATVRAPACARRGVGTPQSLTGRHGSSRC